MPSSVHPADRLGCPDCDADAGTWQQARRLPQVGQTFACNECGQEVHVYDAGDRNETVRKWRPVTHSMATNLLFFDVVGDWPDSALGALFKQGLERAEAIDYHIVEHEGLSQSEWGRRTNRGQPSVSENISKARAKLD